MRRRAFLQRAILALSALGVSEATQAALFRRYQSALAAPAPRKFALLVGINQYPGNPLHGCVTDVDLQREILIHRCGFAKSDILTLTNQQATRAKIEQAYLSHLVEQAAPGDLVVFHFSGCGGKVIRYPEANENAELSLVAARGGEGKKAKDTDLLLETLLLLARSLRTDRLLTVLETSYDSPGVPLQGNLRLRSRPQQSPLALSAEADELSFQADLREQLGRQRATLTQQAIFDQMPGAVVMAGTVDQPATETYWDGFSAGLLTYNLTQRLWHATPATSLAVSVGLAKEAVEATTSSAQHPRLVGQRANSKLLAVDQVLAANGGDGVVEAVDDADQTLRLYLPGLPAIALSQYEAGAILAIAPSAQVKNPTYLQIDDRTGLTAKAKLLPGAAESAKSAIAPASLVHQFVREQVRVVPRNLSLTVALGRELERIERVDAISAFSAIPRISVGNAGEQYADYLFSKVALPTQIASVGDLEGLKLGMPPEGPSTYGLFSVARDAIPNTAGEEGEAIKVAVHRLVPTLRTLLAAKLLSLTVNETASQLPLRVTLETLDSKPQPRLRRETLALRLNTPSKDDPNAANLSTPSLVTLPAGSRLQMRVENRSQVPLYFLLMGLDSGGNLVALYCPPSTQDSASEIPDDTQRAIAAGKTQIIPVKPIGSGFQWIVHSPAGFAENFLVLSRAPFQKTLNLLETTLHPAKDAPNLYTLPNPLEIAQAILQDLHQGSLDYSPARLAEATSDNYSLDVSTWASFHFPYQVV